MLRFSVPFMQGLAVAATVAVPAQADLLRRCAAWLSGDHWVSTPSVAPARRILTIEGMPSAWRQQMDIAYRAVEHREREGAESPTISTPLELGRRWNLGEEHARALPRFGFERTVNRRGETVILPRGPIDSFFAAYAESVGALLENGALTDDDVIYPALVFRRKGARGPHPHSVEGIFEITNEEATDHQFVRPGIDPWPDERHWDLVTSPRQLSHELFYCAIAEGRMPIGVDDFWTHDVAHLTELALHPVIMREMRRYGRELAGRWNRYWGWGWQLFGGNARHRSLILAEFFSLPNIREEAHIRLLVPQCFADEGPRTVPENEAFLRGLSLEDRRAHIQALLDGVERVLLRLGGGIRDGYGQYVHDSEVDRMERIAWGVVHGPAFPRLRVRMLRAAEAMETLPNQLGEIGQLFALRYRLTEEQERLREVAQGIENSYRREGFQRDVQSIGTYPEGERHRRLDVLLLDRVARLEIALFQAVALGITPEIVYTEARNALPATTSLTFRYLRSFVPRGSRQWSAFRLGR